jgi:flagellar protein FliS
MNAMTALNAYRQVGQQGVQEERLLVLGLDGILEYLRRARSAIQERALDRKAQAMGRAYQIVEHLLVALPEAGSSEAGELSQRLAGVYRYLLERMGQANIFDDTQALDDCAAVVTTLRDAWIEGLQRA